MESDPDIGYLRARYSPEELRSIDEYAERLHMEVIPCIQTLAHLKNVVRWNKYPKDGADILMVGAEETYALIDRMLCFFKGIFRSKKIHVGMDEARELGRGKYLDEVGYEDKLVIMKRHLDRVNELCKKIGYSKSYLCRVFHEQTGETIISYAIKIKIKAARRLIREGNLNFSQISDALAFDTPQYFCRVFKRVTGMTPTEFKASLHFDR